MRRILTLTAVLILVLSLSACQLYAHDYKEDVLEYAMIAEDGSELAILDQYPNLEYVDLRGSTCYEAILDYIVTHPTVKVRFSLALGQQFFNQDVTSVELGRNDAAFEDLLNNLKYFRFLKDVHFDQIGITGTQFDELKTAYPQINFTYSVKIGTENYDASVTELNISQLTSQEVEESLSSFEFLPNLSSVDMMDAAGKSKLTVSDAKALMEAYPGITFSYQFKLFGQTVSTTTEKLTYTNTTIGDSGLDQIRDALAVMPNCTDVYLDNCKVSNDAMAQLRADYPDINVVWRIFVDDYSVLSDTETILMRYTVNNQEAEPLKYCTNVKYLDMANCKINDFSFLSNMPDLECAVLQNTNISDLSVLQNCKNLTWLNLTNCTGLRDVTPLSDMDSLKYLNLSATKVKDLSPLSKVSLERFKCAKTSLTPAELSEFKSRHPSCLVTSTGNMTGMGWRYDDANQKEPFAYYTKMKEVFGYDN